MQKRIRILRLLLAALLPGALLTAWGAPALAQLPSTIPEDSPFAPQPGAATLQGDIQQWDAYGDPADQAPTLLPPGQDSFLAQPQVTAVEQMRVLRQIHFEYTLLGNNGGFSKLGLNEIALNATFQFPLGQHAPILLTPGFSFQMWEGPVGTVATTDPDMPPRTYGAYVDLGWQPQFTPWFGADVGVRPGIYTDFRENNSDTFRIKGRGLGIFTVSPAWQVVAGVVYLDRNRVKLLPAGGLIWTPHQDVRWEILFPQPKLSQRLTTVGNIQWWWYVGGEYGGDAWTIERADGTRDSVDYNDIRVYGGIEWLPCEGVNRLSGSIELGYVFERELLYLNTLRFKPSETYMVRASLRY